MAKVLVIGGAGYVGSATVAWLSDRGHQVTILDNLTTGRRELLLGTPFIHSDMGNENQLDSLFASERFDCVFHFAAKTIVSESVSDPEGYFENNVSQTEHFLQSYLKSCRAHDCTPRLVFSSTCAIFGDPGKKDITEDLPKNPMNPYGSTKLAAEKLIEKQCKEVGMHAIALRYFNACGAEPKYRVGEWHFPETHLIPRLFQAVRRGSPVELFGEDYPTPDGSCIRDYVHVWDLAHAHGAAMERLLLRESRAYQSIGQFEAFNLGSGKGFSVKEVVAATERVTGTKLAIQVHPRRPGDPPRLVSGSKLASKELDFAPQYLSIDSIVESAWRWELQKLSRRAVFLDRDGTLNQDPGYLSDPSEVHLFPEVGPALKRLKELGYLLVVVSNQSGVGRGKITKNQLEQVNEKINSLLGSFDAKIDHFELCLHRPEDECLCRKPQPKLLQDAADYLGIDLSRSFMIGDKISDLQAGVSAGCLASILVKTGEGQTTVGHLDNEKDYLIAANLLEAVQRIHSLSSKESVSAQ